MRLKNSFVYFQPNKRNTDKNDLKINIHISGTISPSKLHLWQYGASDAHHRGEKFLVELGTWCIVSGMNGDYQAMQ